jgi:hypothetical protein
MAEVYNHGSSNSDTWSQEAGKISTMGYFSKDQVELHAMFSTQSNHITARDYLHKGIYPTLEEALTKLITTIEENGEFERYVDMLADR